MLWVWVFVVYLSALLESQDCHMTPTDLRSLRLALRLTQAQLAQRLEVSRNTVQRWECGTSRIPAAVQQELEQWKREQLY